jgi:AcrR family transcriptional regulator
MAQHAQSSLFDLANAPREGQSKHDAIMAAATLVFIENGYEGASMDQLALAAGAARRTLYNQFPDGKPQIFRAVAERMWRAFPEMDIATDEAALSDPKIGLTRIARGVATFWAPPLAIAFLRLVIAEGRRFPDLTKTFFEVGKTQAMTAVRDYIGELARRGLLTLDDPDLASKQFLGLVDEPVLWGRVMGDPVELSQQDLDAVVEGAVAIFLGHYART